MTYLESTVQFKKKKVDLFDLLKYYAPVYISIANFICVSELWPFIIQAITPQSHTGDGKLPL